jgi:holo-[acyl-carrier protein] synthase
MRSGMQMTQSCIGIDLIEISRISRAVSRWGERFLFRVYTGPELERYGHRMDSLAARFAAKEAAIKALDLAGMAVWKDIEILSEPDGKPTVNLYGHALERARQLGLSSVAISLAHSRENAIAIVFGTAEY